MKEEEILHEEMSIEDDEEGSDLEEMSDEYEDPDAIDE